MKVPWIRVPTFPKHLKLLDTVCWPRFQHPNLLNIHQLQVLADFDNQLSNWLFKFSTKVENQIKHNWLIVFNMQAHYTLPHRKFSWFINRFSQNIIHFSFWTLIGSYKNWTLPPPVLFVEITIPVHLYLEGKLILHSATLDFEAYSIRMCRMC